MGAPFKQHHIAAAPAEPGLYRTVTGAESLALGLVAGCQLAGVKMFFGSYPITPASPLLHHLARLKEFGITTFQAEDEIAAICAAIGASYAGQLGITSSSGPGIALKTEAIGLAVMTELPLVIVNSQRGGPSTGLPTKTEQSDLYQAVYGRNARRAAAGDRRPLAGRRVRLRDRGVPHRHALHDSGDAADRRLYRQRRRAVASAGHERLSSRSRCSFFETRAGRRRAGHAVCAQRRARAAVDQAGHARPRAPHRRHREGSRAPATSIIGPKSTRR